MAQSSWPDNIEKISILLSIYLDRKVTGSRDEINNRRQVMVTEEGIHNRGQNNSTFLYGSVSEGFNLPDSDTDIVIVDNRVMATYPGQRVQSVEKTVLYINEAGCQPGYVTLQLIRTGPMCSTVLQNSIIPVGDDQFVSCDIFQELTVKKYREMGLPSQSIGRRYNFDKFNFVHSFHCDSWPMEASEWASRTRLHGWPPQTLVEKIIQKGCHLVPIKDRSLKEKSPQWKISFAPAEKALVYSFSQVQLKVYCLLKYFFQEIRDVLTKSTGVNNILSSDFLRTVMFFVIENSYQNIWQEQNLFFCFWFCVNTLITHVKTGHLPNYFIPVNNMFLGKATSKYRKRLFHILNYFHKNKLLCLSFGKMFQPSFFERICDVTIQTELKYPQTAREIEYQRDMSIIFGSASICNRPASMTTSMTLLMKSQSEVGQVIGYGYTLKNISLFAQRNYRHHVTRSTGNKSRYKMRRKSRHQIKICSSMGTGTEILYLATFYFLTGSYSKTLQLCTWVMSQPSYYTEGLNDLPPKQKTSYLHDFCGKGYTLIHKLKKTQTKSICFVKECLFLPQLQPEVVKSPSGLFVPPLPYAVFLSFLCCHELGDTKGREAALCYLIVVKYDDLQGAQKHWVVHNLLGICYETLSDNRRAIRAYFESAQTKTMYHDFNPALERIEALQSSDRTGSLNY
ncbi:uncharacterized protein LOC117320590 [Pecten maximus]|uniref:uncharacterized protein LOC117320590 n=1 Tax=Pecten maximus TaxID=6579 RepID=UPI0014580215|nr:uncharacterized protein LOC117320590 [Pecten maximus]